MSKVLVIDDDRSVLALVTKALADTDSTLLTAENAKQGLEALKENRPDVLLLDQLLPDKTGVEIAQEIRVFDARLPVIFITVSEDSDVAIEAMKLGAYEYVLKPLGVDQIQDLVERALETRRLMKSPVHFQQHEADEQNAIPVEGDVLVGKSRSMVDVYKQIGRVAAQDVSVLIRGESGTGKELIARAIYQHSHRKEGCFLAVNCAALSDTLLESELFGHEKGAFTGAERRHIGKFEQCSNGTIFLDEVGDMSPLTQSKVLRVLQEKQFERVGGSETIHADVRMVSATNRDLEQMIKDGEFRLDLYHRLNGFEIFLPPLRDRGDDLQLLLHFFLARFNRQLQKKITGISPDAMAALEMHPWPGNVRQLQSILRKAMLMATGPVLTPEFLPEEILHGKSSTPGAPDTSSSGNEDVQAAPSEQTDLANFVDEREAAQSNDLFAESQQWMERYLLRRVLQQYNGNQSKAAERLGITRGSLRHKLKSLGISIDQVVKED